MVVVSTASRCCTSDLRSGGGEGPVIDASKEGRERGRDGGGGGRNTFLSLRWGRTHCLQRARDECVHTDSERDLIIHN